MIRQDGNLELRLARSPSDVKAAQRLRYRVFVDELGGDGDLVDHDSRLEIDRFDPFCEHLLLIDKRRDAAAGDHVVGVYRMMTQRGADQAGGYYSETEFDLAALHGSGRNLLELGRSCVDVGYRGGGAMFSLWNGLARYLTDNNKEILFGVASFHGVDLAKIAEPLSYLHKAHLAPIDLRVTARGTDARAMTILDPSTLERRRALRQMPPMIKAYLRLGGCVGQGCFLDRAFNTTDVCMVMDTARFSEAQRNRYWGAQAG